MSDETLSGKDFIGLAFGGFVLGAFVFIGGMTMLGHGNHCNKKKGIQEPSNRKAVVFCGDGDAMVATDYEVRPDGRIAYRVENVYVLTPTTCGLMAVYPEQETKVASK